MDSPFNINSSYRRRLRNYFISPGQQLRLAGISFVGLLLGIGAHTALILHLFQQQLLDQGFDDALLAHVRFITLLSFVVVSTVTGLYMLIVNIVYTHRIFGSLFAVQNHIKRVLDGESVDKLPLRQNDETQILVSRVNELVERYQKK